MVESLTMVPLIHDRMKELRAICAEEEMPYSEASEEPLMKFALQHLDMGTPRIVVTHEGKLRAIWKMVF